MPTLDPGARVASIPPGLIARAGEAARYVISGVAPATWFGPNTPAKPLAPESAKGRAFDYPVGYNLRYPPRADETVSFAMLHALASGCDMLRIVIETRKDQIEGLDWQIRPRDEDNVDQDALDRAKKLTDFWQRPDGTTQFASRGGFGAPLSGWQQREGSNGTAGSLTEHPVTVAGRWGSSVARRGRERPPAPA